MGRDHIIIADNLSHITKLALLQVLQMIGNLSTEIDAKELYMSAIASILPRGVKRIKEYIQNMVQIDQRIGGSAFVCECACVLFTFMLSYV